MKFTYSYITPPSLFEILSLSEMDSTPFALNQTIQGELNEFHCPIVTLAIQGKEYEAILDTGAYNSHVSPYTLMEMGLTPDKADGHTVNAHPSIGDVQSMKFKISFGINGIKANFQDEFTAMVTQYPYPFILGSLFMHKCKELHIYSQENRF